MSRAWLLLVSTLFFLQTARAEEAYPEIEQLPTYHQMMSLSPTARMNYLIKFQQLLLKVKAIGRTQPLGLIVENDEPSAPKNSRFEALFDLMLLPVAHADDENTYQVCQKTDNGYCIWKAPSRELSINGQTQVRYCSNPDQKGDCTNGGTLTSVSNLSPDALLKIQNIANQQPSVQPTAAAAPSRSTPAKGAPGVIPNIPPTPQITDSGGGETKLSDQIVQTRTTPFQGTVSPPETKKSLTSGAPAPTGDDPDQPSVNLTAGKSAASVAPAKSGDAKPGEAKPSDAKPTDPKAAAPATKPGGSTCDKASETKAIADYHTAGGKDNPCMYAGSVTGYKDNQFTINNCQRSGSSFCLAEDDNGHAPAKCPAASSYDCADNKNVICNPLVFGVAGKPGQEGTKALCVPPSADATTNCAKAAANYSGKNKEDFLNTAGNGVDHKWDSFAANFNKVCKPGTPQAKAHCIECATVRKELKAMNTNQSNHLYDVTGDSGDPAVPAAPSSGSGTPAAR